MTGLYPPLPLNGLAMYGGTFLRLPSVTIYVTIYLNLKKIFISISIFEYYKWNEHHFEYIEGSRVPPPQKKKRGPERVKTLALHNWTDQKVHSIHIVTKSQLPSKGHSKNIYVYSILIPLSILCSHHNNNRIISLF